MSNRTVRYQLIKGGRTVLNADFYWSAFSVHALTVANLISIAIEQEGLTPREAVEDISTNAGSRINILKRKKDSEANYDVLINFDDRVIYFNVFDHFTKHEYINRLNGRDAEFMYLPEVEYDFAKIPFDDAHLYIKFLMKEEEFDHTVFKYGDNTVLRFFGE